MTDIFQEVDEELRRDRLVQLWQRYRWAAYGAAVLVVVAAGGISEWRDWQHRKAMALGTRFTNATLLADTDEAKATTELEVLGAGGSSGYPLLARFQAAALKAKGADKAASIAAYDAIAADRDVDVAYRDLATILSADLQVDTAPKAELLAKLQPLTAAANPWRTSALELSALADLKGGDTDGAVKLYQQIADDSDAPPASRARAREVIEALRHQG